MYWFSGNYPRFLIFQINSFMMHFAKFMRSLNVCSNGCVCHVCVVYVCYLCVLYLLCLVLCVCVLKLTKPVSMYNYVVYMSCACVFRHVKPLQSRIPPLPIPSLLISVTPVYLFRSWISQSNKVRSSQNF